MNVKTLLESCDPNMKVAITNENGTGGAAYVAWPDADWTAKQALDELGCGGYHVCGIEIRDGMLYITADENPWDFGSYHNGDWYGVPTDTYELSFGATIYVREPNEDAAINMAWERIMDCDFDYEELVITDVR